ncbi:MAG: polyprenyl diphosphate synthase [Candidatus Geothermincolia bacterium]
MDEAFLKQARGLHVAVIMDGNGRWASTRDLPRIAGHKAGERAITDIIRAASEWGLGALSLFAFSTENWNRPRNEVTFLMTFNRNLLRRRVNEFDRRNIRVQVIGRREPIPGATLAQMDRSWEQTRDNTGLKLNICFNYGGRAEIVDAARSLAEEARGGNIRPEDIDAASLTRHTYVPDVPDADLMIRTAGEYRISNFILWRLPRTALYVSDRFWPDFRREDLVHFIQLHAAAKAHEDLQG